MAFLKIPSTKSAKRVVKFPMSVPEFTRTIPLTDRVNKPIKVNCYLTTRPRSVDREVNHRGLSNHMNL